MTPVRKNRIAYRCPDCGVATLGLLGALTSVSDMLRIKCECGGPALDVQKLRDGKIHLSIPCVYCKTQHGYVLHDDIASRGELTMLACPYSNMDIAFIGSDEDISPELTRTADELARVLVSLEAETLADIQPMDIDEDAALPEPQVFDAINFIVRDLEDAGNITCPCKNGKYELRFCEEGIQVFCENCGAAYTFYAKGASAAEEYLSLDAIELK